MAGKLRRTHPRTARFGDIGRSVTGSGGPAACLAPAGPPNQVPALVKGTRVSRLLPFCVAAAILLMAIGRLGRAAEPAPATPPTKVRDGNRLAYLDENNPWYPHRDFPKLITPQWVGEEGVECVVILAIDDMRDPAKYEAFLRPILQRLKRIDGRAPVSIMTCSVKPDDPQLASWLAEG